MQGRHAVAQPGLGDAAVEVVQQHTGRCRPSEVAAAVAQPVADHHGRARLGLDRLGDARGRRDPLAGRPLLAGGGVDRQAADDALVEAATAQVVHEAALVAALGHEGGARAGPLADPTRMRRVHQERPVAQRPDLQAVGVTAVPVLGVEVLLVALGVGAVHVDQEV